MAGEAFVAVVERVMADTRPGRRFTEKAQCRLASHLCGDRPQYLNAHVGPVENSKV